jgi:predicted aspartyl protease
MKWLPVSVLSTAVLLAGAHAGESPFDPTRGLVELPVVVNGLVRGKFGLDTGADRLYVDKTFATANRLGTTRTIKYEVRGIDGTSPAAHIELGSLRFADETLIDIGATVIDLSALTKDTTGGVPDGLIGFDVLRRFYVTVDFPNQSINLEQSQPAFLNGNRYEEVPFDLVKHFVMVDVIINGTIPARMMLDYCASYTVITPAFATRLGTDGEYAKLESIALGSSETPQVRVVIADHSNILKGSPDLEIDGILGATFLYPHVITVDYRRAKIYVHE